MLDDTRGTRMASRQLQMSVIQLDGALATMSHTHCAFVGGAGGMLAGMHVKRRRIHTHDQIVPACECL